MILLLLLGSTTGMILDSFSLRKVLNVNWIAKQHLRSTNSAAAHPTLTHLHNTAFNSKKKNKKKDDSFRLEKALRYDSNSVFFLSEGMRKLILEVKCYDLGHKLSIIKPFTVVFG